MALVVSIKFEEVESVVAIAPFVFAPVVDSNWLVLSETWNGTDESVDERKEASVDEFWGSDGVSEEMKIDGEGEGGGGGGVKEGTERIWDGMRIEGKGIGEGADMVESLENEEESEWLFSDGVAVVVSNAGAGSFPRYWTVSV